MLFEISAELAKRCGWPSPHAPWQSGVLTCSRRSFQIVDCPAHACQRHICPSYCRGRVCINLPGFILWPLGALQDLSRLQLSHRTLQFWSTSRTSRSVFEFHGRAFLSQSQQTYSKIFLAMKLNTTEDDPKPRLSLHHHCPSPSHRCSHHYWRNSLHTRASLLAIPRTQSIEGQGSRKSA